MDTIKMFSALVVLIILILGANYLFDSGSITGNVIATTENDHIDTMETLVDNDPYLGSVYAPITLIQFGDYSSDQTRRFNEIILPKLKTTYIETGKVRYVFRDFPSDRISEKAAQASECAKNQGKFWEYHDLLLENQNRLDEYSLNYYARQVRLDIEEFNNCLITREKGPEVSRDSTDAMKYGLKDTPAFVINGEKMENIESYPDFVTKIIELSG